MEAGSALITPKTKLQIIYMLHVHCINKYIGAITGDLKFKYRAWW